MTRLLHLKWREAGDFGEGAEIYFWVSVQDPRFSHDEEAADFVVQEGYVGWHPTALGGS